MDKMRKKVNEIKNQTESINLYKKIWIRPTQQVCGDNLYIFPGFLTNSHFKKLDEYPTIPSCFIKSYNVKKNQTEKVVNINKHIYSKNRDTILEDGSPAYLDNDFCQFISNNINIVGNKAAIFYRIGTNIEDNEAPIKAANIQNVPCALAALIFFIPKLI